MNLMFLVIKPLPPLIMMVTTTTTMITMIALCILFLEIRKWKIPSHFCNAAHGMVLPWQTLFSLGSCGLWGSVWPSACKLQSEKEPIAKLCLRLL